MAQIGFKRESTRFLIGFVPRSEEEREEEAGGPDLIGSDRVHCEHPAAWGNWVEEGGESWVAPAMRHRERAKA